MAIYLLLCSALVRLLVRAADLQLPNDHSFTNTSDVLTFEDRLRLLEETLSARNIMESNSVEDRLFRLERTLMAAYSRVSMLESKLRHEALASDKQKSALADDGGDISTVGVSFIRWGRTMCNDSYTNATTVYTGYTADSAHNKDGGGTNFLCLHENPQWGTFRKDGFHKYTALIHGTETESYPNNPDHLDPFSTRNSGGRPVVNNPLPCAACYVPRQSTWLMIPARTECPLGWTLQYKGYMQSALSGHGHQKTNYVCVDEAPEIGVGGVSQNQALLYTVEVGCGSLPCSVFTDGAELTCVVCTR